jgi:hypothetical protein
MGRLAGTLLSLLLVACGSQGGDGAQGVSGLAGQGGRPGADANGGAGGLGAVLRDRDHDGFTADVDCDDLDPSVGPATDWFADRDGDGYGSPDLSIHVCAPGTGWLSDASDCDDTDDTVHPGAADIENGVDDDCDGVTDNPDLGTVVIPGLALWSAIYGSGVATVDDASIGFTDATVGDDAGATVDVADINGDGIGDLLVGAPFAGDGALRGGAAIVVLGGEDLSGQSALSEGSMISGSVSDSCLGATASAVGDINGDGADDFVLGTSYGDSAWIVMGAAGDWTLHASEADLATAAISGDGLTWVGSGAAPLGDIDQDGYDDFVIAQAGGSAGAGAALLMYGSATPPSGLLGTEAAGASLLGTSSGDRLGARSSSYARGDFNGDGLADMVVGAPGTETGGTATGRVTVIWGQAQRLSGSIDIADAGTNIDATGAVQGLGGALAAIGDHDGDGLVDLIVGAPSSDIAADNAGAAFLFLGSSAGWSEGDTDSATAAILGESAADALGVAVAGVGDVDGDGTSDLAIGAPGYDGENLPSAGALYVVLGNATQPTGQRSAETADARLVGSEPFDRAGTSVAGGDVTGDGISDLVGGAPGRSLVFVFQGWGE